MFVMSEFMSSVLSPIDEFDSVETFNDGCRLFVEYIFVNDEELDESLDRPDRITFEQVLAKIMERFWKVECAHRFKLKILVNFHLLRVNNLFETCLDLNEKRS